MFTKPAENLRPTSEVVAVEAAIAKSIDYCRANDWAGHDPYDALNSPVFRIAPFLDRRIPRLVFTQALKRSPIDFRRILQIPKVQNPKGLALFLSAFLTLERVNPGSHQADVRYMIDRLKALRSPGEDYWCWGYSFPWQTRTIIVPSGTPNLVCTTFVANSLLDAFEERGDSQCLEMATSAASYILDKLYWTDDSAVGFSYPLPSLRSHVHNANLLAAALLCRVYTHTKNEKLLPPALQVARYSASKQNQDGSWFYGEAPSQKWIDNFHTGYNLGALQQIGKYANTRDFDSAVSRGFEFYRKHFFREDGSVRYFHDRDYPIDVHCVAQSIITLLGFNDEGGVHLQVAQSVLRWALAHMWDNKGFFYYRKQRTYTDRTSYMRWSQAWMLLAMAMLCETSKCLGASRPSRGLAEVAHD